jgi:hypothetical protein
MFNAPYCWCCGKKEHFNGYGCNNPDCKEYYKLKELKRGAKNTEQQAQADPSDSLTGCYTDTN